MKITDPTNSSNVKIDLSKLSVFELEKLLPKVNKQEDKYAVQIHILIITRNLPEPTAEKILGEIVSQTSIKKNKQLHCLATLQLVKLNKKDEPKATLKLLQKLLKIHNKKNELQMWLKINEQIISHYIIYNEKDKAKALLNEVLPYAKNEYCIEEKICLLACYISIYKREAKFDLAIARAYEAIDLAKENNYQYLLARIYSYIFFCFTNVDKQIEIANETLKYAISSGGTYYTAVSHSFLAQLYADINEFKKAFLHADEALIYCKKSETESVLINAYITMVRVYTYKLQRDKSYKIPNKIKKQVEEYSLLLMQFANRTKRFEHLFTFSIVRAELLLCLKQYQSSIDVILNIGIEKKRKKLDKIKVANCYEILFKNYYALSDFENALKYHIKYSTKDKEIKDENTAKRAEELESKYESKQKEEEVKRLQELEEIKARFFSQITHELRTPLTLIKGPIQSILKSKYTNNVKSAKIVDRNADRLLLLVNQLLDVNKLESGKMQLKNRVGYFDEFINDLVAPFESLAKQQKIKFTLKSNINKLALNFDADKVEKIIYNLLSNAFKFTGKGESVTLSIKKSIAKKPDYFNIQIKVADTGAGIDKENLSKIFDRFYQADNSLSRKAEGTGIGLSLVKEITQLLEGEIKVVSKINKGTTFTVDLFLESGEHLVQEIEGNKRAKRVNVIEEKPTNARTYRKASLKKDAPILLIIEDNEDMHEYIKSILTDEYKILKAENGKEGIEIAKEKIPDIIISDVMMPIKNGYEVCNELKTNEATSHIPIILLTAKAALKSRIQGFEQGADAYMAKPFSAEELKLQSKNLLQTLSNARDKYSQLIKDSNRTIFKENKNNKEAEFLSNAITAIEQHISDDEFTAEKLAKLLYISSSQLYRKIQALTACSPSEFVRTTRLAKGKQLLESGKGNVSEIAYEVGLKPSYFSRTFKKQYGLSPAALLESLS